MSATKQTKGQGTPGPWSLETVKTQVGVCHKIGKLGSTTKLNYACLYDDCYSNQPRDMQLLTDARIISTAPDGVALARLVVSFYADFHELNTSTEKEIYEKARSIIARVEADNGK